MRIKIVADSTCDLSPELLQRHDIRSVPLTIIMGEKGYKDSVEVTPRDIFAYVQSGKGISHTSAVNVEEYQEVFAEELANGADAIINFTISSRLSSGFENACMAAAAVAAVGNPSIHNVDTLSLSTGGGWLVLYAAELAEQGVGFSELVRRCEAKKLLSEASFVIDTLEYLHKGGRCSGLTALGANLFSLKPCLELRGGEIKVGRKYRGNIQKVLSQYLKDRLEKRTDLDLRRAIITHTMYDDPQFVAEMVGLAQELQPFDEVISTDAGCTISNHCGPGCLGILIYKKDSE